MGYLLSLSQVPPFASLKCVCIKLATRPDQEVRALSKRTSPGARIRNRLRAGNARFLDDQKLPPKKHAPTLAVLACADARVDPARIFSSPPGELFVVRTAGNVVCEHGLESLAYAVKLGAEAVIVLGHTDCGAIKDALADNPRLPATAASIRSHLRGEASLDRAARVHAAETATELRRTLGKEVPVLAALYHTESGEVEWL